MTRTEKVKFAYRITDAAVDALDEMRKTPDTPVDLSDIPVGALALLKSHWGVALLHSGDQVFGIMDTESDESDD